MGRARHADYKAGKVSEEVMCGEMVTLHKGLEEAVIQEATDRFFEDNLVSGIFPEMQALLHRLHDNGCEVWAVSSEQSMDYSISHAAFQNSSRTNSCYGSESYWRARDGSTDSYTEWSWKTGSDPIGSQARSRRYVWKFPMGSRDARDVAAPFAINPKPDLEKIAHEQGWPVYFPEGTE